MYRAEFEKIEYKFLHEKAVKSRDSKGREKREKPCKIRTAFQRDRDRILHSKSFRRLKGKTQVFLSPVGDHYRTRLTHTLEVAQIARTIGRALRLNEDLIEAIALGHDIGHTPFGHTGEAVLNTLLGEHGGFRHPQQSLRVVSYIEKNGMGLNLTEEVRDGILKHSKGFGEIIKKDAMPSTLEGQVVRISDIIAYINHDLDDAIRAGVIRKSRVPMLDYFGKRHSRRITKIVEDVVFSTMERDYEMVVFSEEMEENVVKMRDFLKEHVYFNPYVKAESEKSRNIIEFLFNYFTENYREIPFYKEILRVLKSYEPYEAARDFIAGMTDKYAIEQFREIFMPKPWTIL